MLETTAAGVLYGNAINTFDEDANANTLSSIGLSNLFRLQLDNDEDGSVEADDIDEESTIPRRLVQIETTGELLAYGGSKECIRKVNLDVSSENSTESTVGTNTKSTASTSIVVHTSDSDDTIRAFAISTDGRRVAIGNDTGEIKIFTYDVKKKQALATNDDIREDANSKNTHPFCLNTKKFSSYTKNNSSTDSYQQLGLTFDAQIRDIQFYPQSSDCLAIATESGMCLVYLEGNSVVWKKNISSLNNEEKDNDDDDDDYRHHDLGGIRSLEFHTLVEADSSSNNMDVVVMASLSMDGRLLLWDVSNVSSKSLDVDQWKPIYIRTIRKKFGEEKSTSSSSSSLATKCIMKNDVGEVLGADPWDRSCRPMFITIPRRHTNNHKSNNKGNNINNNDDDDEQYKQQQRIHVLALPGMTYLQLRRLDYNTETGIVSMEQFDQPTMSNNNNKNDNITKTTDGVIQGHIEPIVTFATTGTIHSSYLISSGRDKRIVLWSIHQRKDDGSIQSKFVKQIGQFDSAPTHLLWEKKHCMDAGAATATDDHNMKCERLLIAFANGKLGIIQGRHNIIPAKRLQNVVDENKSQTAAERRAMNSEEYPEDNALVSNFNTTKSILKSSTNKIGGTATRSEKDSDKAVPHQKKLSFIDDEAEEDDFPEKATSPISKGERNAHVDSTTEKNERTAQNMVHNQYDDPSVDEDDNEDDDDSNSLVGFISKQPRSVVDWNLPKLQPPFAVSSTPLDLPRRFMCWNHIGSITLVYGDYNANDDNEAGDSKSNKHNTVDINFTDSFSRRNITFTDNLGFIVGSLGEDGALFATDVADDDDDGNDDDDGVDYFLSKTTKEAIKRDKQKSLMKKSSVSSKPTGSTLYFNRFETIGNVRDKDWVVTLPSGERAVGCACGEGWAAVTTSRRFLRFFSPGGNQGQILWISGEPVTIVGRGRFAAIFYHGGDPLRDGTQQIGYMLVDGQTANVIAKGHVSSISSTSSLLWAGFSNDGSLITMDAAGMISMLIHTWSGGETTTTSMNWEWIPMLDTIGLKKSSDDTFWPISVFDGKLVCVPLKGGTKFPDTVRRPITTALTFRMPIARGAISKSNALEEISLRACIALHQKKLLNDLQFGDPLSDRDYLSLSAQVDKVTLKMFASNIEAGKVERALDLVDRLHLEKSFDLAMTIADKHRKLVDMIEILKENRFPGNISDDDGNASIEESTMGYHTTDKKRISPDSSDRARNVRPRSLH